MIFTWLFGAYHDIPELRKYGFLCSVINLQGKIKFYAASGQSGCFEFLF